MKYKNLHPGLIAEFIKNTNNYEKLNIITKINSDFRKMASHSRFELGFPKLDGNNVISFYSGYCKENGLDISNIPLSDLCNFIKNISDNETRIIFDNSMEGNIDDCLIKIHEIVKITNLPSKNFYYISGAFNCVELYEKFVLNNNISKNDKINIGGLNLWEWSTRGNFEHLKYPIEYTVKKKDKLLLCFNRVVRPHRILLTGHIIKKNLLDRCYYSFHPLFNHVNAFNSVNQSFKIVENLHGFVMGEYFSKYLELLKQNSNIFPLKLNIEPTTNKTWVDNDDKEYYENSYFSVTTETNFFPDLGSPYSPDVNNVNRFNTVYRGNSVFLTEKTFKPIIMKHPFIMVSRPGTLKALRQCGYKTFHPFIDESYDEIKNNIDRLDAISDEIERLSKFTDDMWIEWQSNIKEIVEWNYNVIKFKSSQPLSMFVTEKNF